MNFAEYRKLATRTWNEPLRGASMGREYLFHGLASEVGEVSALRKRMIRDAPHPAGQFRQKLIAELGDVLWYVDRIAEEYNINLEEVASTNIAKLADRAARGVLKGSGDNR